MKIRKILLAAAVLASMSQVAHADLHEVGHDIKTTTVSAGQKVGHAARDAGHATAHAAKTVGHGIADASKHGYHAVKDAFHKHDTK